MTDASQKNPLGPTGKIAARRLQELREKAGLSYKDLSEKLQARGRRIPPLGLRRIESEDRRIDTDDLVALALVLGVNPSALLLPMTIEGDVEVTGAGVVPARRAWDWIDGRLRLEPVDDDGAAEVEFQLRARPPHFRRRLSFETTEGRRLVADQLEADGGFEVERDSRGGVRSIRPKPDED